MSVLLTIQREVYRLPLQAWRHKDDLELYGRVRNCATQLGGCPAVFDLVDGYKIELTRDWQFYIRAINYAMTAHHVSALFGDSKAFCNGSGLGGTVPRADWIMNENTNRENPSFDKVRTCARSILSGTVEGNELIINAMDGSHPPPLKAGRAYPTRLEDVDLDDYLFNPQDHRWMFLVANNIGEDGGIFPFDNGGRYAWTEEQRPYTFLPHVARGMVRYPLNNLVMIPAGSPIPSPYRRR